MKAEKEMKFRFIGEMPQGRFEFTCLCGNYSVVELKLLGSEQKIKCEKCDAIIAVWQQPGHWHMKINAGAEK